MSGGGGGGGSSNTVTQVQQIPQFEQDFAQQNQSLAQSLGSQPYPTYQGALIQGFSPLQTQGQNMAVNAAGAYQPELSQAGSAAAGALNPGAVNGLTQAGVGSVGRALSLSPANPGNVSAFMSPYVEASLAPQMQDLQIQLGQQQRAIDAQATQANAFGDARQGAAQALQNLYGNQAMTQLLGQGYNNAYGQALSALQGQQGVALNSASALGNLGNLQLNEQGQQIQGANTLGNLAGLNQSLGITGANAIYNAGQQQQQLGQQELNTAYQQYLNQVNWPYQMLNVQESALSNSPYNIQTAVTLPSANTTAQGFGTLGNIGGVLGGLLSGSGSANAPFGGSTIQGTH